MKSTLMALAALGALGALPAAAAAQGADGCDLEWSHPVTLSDAGGERLTVSIEGPSCTEAGVLWRIHDSEGALLWAEASSFAMLTAPDSPAFEPGSRAEVEQIYSGKSAPGPVGPRTGALPEWPDREDAGPHSFDIPGQEPGLTFAGQSAEDVTIYEWNAARELDRPTVCLVPGTHYANCYWLTPYGELQLLYHALW